VRYFAKITVIHCEPPKGTKTAEIWQHLAADANRQELTRANFHRVGFADFWLPQIASSWDNRFGANRPNEKVRTVTIPRDMFAAARELTAGEYETVAAFVWQAVQKEIDLVHRKKLTGQRNNIG
jgi:hypothetical protein